MGMLIKEMLDDSTLQVLTSNFTPNMLANAAVKYAARDLIKTISALELYPDYQLLIDRFELLRKNYPALYTHRTFFLWQMTQAVFQFTALKIPHAYFLQSNFLKCQAGVLTVIFDDICDMGGDKAIFHKSLLALKGQISQGETELYELIANTWSTFQFAITQTPNYLLLKPTLEKAYEDWFASFEYSILMQEESFRVAQKWEKQLEIIAHSATLYLAGLIDLLFVPNLSANQVMAASEVFLSTQKMTELGNWIVTWNRELAQRDFTSGVFTVATAHGWITWNDLQNGSLEQTRQQIKDSPVDSYLWEEWEKLSVKGHKIVQDTRLLALDGYVESFSAIMLMLVAGTGQI